MKRRNFIKTTMIGAGVCLTPNVLFGKVNKELPNVLIIGDSISIGYTKSVQELLKGKANVFRPLNAKGGFLNCQGTTFGIKKIDEWLSAKKWDVIHFNFGLHDLKHVDAKTGKNSKKQSDPQQADLKAYKKNLSKIVKKLKATNAKLIFATTTPYPDKPGGPLRRADQPIKYNKVALKIMSKNKIAINDLHAFVLPHLNELLHPNNVHFTKEGSKILAEELAKHISKML